MISLLAKGPIKGKVYKKFFNLSNFYGKKSKIKRLFIKTPAKRIVLKDALLSQAIYKKQKNF